MKKVFFILLCSFLSVFILSCHSDDESSNSDNLYDNEENVLYDSDISDYDETNKNTDDSDKYPLEEDLETSDEDDMETSMEAVIISSETKFWEHDSADFQAKVNGGTPPYSFNWDFDGAAPASQEQNPENIVFYKPGDYHIVLTVKDADDFSTETFLDISVIPLEGSMQFFFGNLHSHSGVSDGKGTPSEVMEWARNQDNLDFYAMTDHAEQIFSHEWDAVQTQTDLTTENGVFVALRGFEWSHPVFGHINVYETEKYTAAYDKLTIKDFYDWIEKNNGIAQFNHPGREIDHFNNLKLEPHVVSNMFAIETGNKSTGNNDGEFIPYYIKALDNGWQVAPASNQDNHQLEINSHRTAYIGEELTRFHLIDAMNARRLYSSDDPDIKIVFKYQEHWMGSHVNVQKDELRFSVKVMDNEPVLKMEILTNNGTVIAEIEPGEEDDPMNMFWFPKLNITQNAYFFLKVTSEDIYDNEKYDVQIALTAPIWIYR